MTPHKTALLRVGTAIAVALVALGAILGGVRAASSAFASKTPAAKHADPDLAPASRNHDLNPAASSAGATGTPPPRATDAQVSLGRTIFFDPRLSVPEGTSCASCHD